VLIRQLRELEDTASKRTPEQLARERYALELEAAGVLVALDERTASERTSRATKPRPKTGVPAEGAGTTAHPDRAGMRGFLWGAATATAVLLLGFFVYQSAQPRESGGSVTGGGPAGPGPMQSRAPGGAATPDGEEAQIQAALARNPQDIRLRLTLVRAYVERQNWMAVWKESATVLEQAPGNPQALAYQALVRLTIGQSEQAVNTLAKVVVSDPDMMDAWAFLLMGYARLGRMKDAEATVARASKRFPDRAADFRQLLAEQREAAASQTSLAPGQSDPHAGLAAPGEKTSDATAPARSAGRRVAGTVDIDPSLKSTVEPRAVLFVFVRAAGAAGGPPVAVKRLPPTFPATFELSEADSMMGQPFPDQLLIEARLDSDGDPTTRPATDPKARLDRVKAGSTGLHLVLRR
jgi:tetratricopeptide (TPR) repeat protein